MRTALFPPNDEQLYAKQGPYGNCFLLSAVICIYNSCNEGRQFLKAKCKVYPNGIEIRLQHTDQSKHLHTTALPIKYHYSYCPINNQDVFL